MEGLNNKYLEDEKILIKLNQQDRKTEYEIYHRFRDYFFGFLMNKFNCKKEECQEIYPESYAILCKNIRNNSLTVPLKSSLETYLCGIGWRVFLKRFRRNKKPNSNSSSPIFLNLEVWDDIGEWVELDNQIEWEAKANLLRKVLPKLNEPCQKVIRMKYWEELSYQEIMDNMNFSTLGAARKRHFDCIQKLRSLLKKMDLDQYL